MGNISFGVVMFYVLINPTDLIAESPPALALAESEQVFQGTADVSRDKVIVSIAEKSALFHSQKAMFVPTDVGKWIVVAGAGASWVHDGQSIVGSLTTIINLVIDANNAELATLAGTSLVATRTYVTIGTDNSRRIQAALLSLPANGSLYFPAADKPYGVSVPITIPDSKHIKIYGAGQGLSTITALNHISALILLQSKSGGRRFDVEHLTLDGNRVTDIVLSLQPAQNSIVNDLEILNAAPPRDGITANVMLGDSQNHLIENRLSELVLKNDPEMYRPHELPLYNLFVASGTSDNMIGEIIASDAAEANIYDASFGANLYTRIHAYGFPVPSYLPKYSFWSLGNASFLECFSDGSTVAGFRSDGDSNAFSLGIFGWGGPPVDGSVGILLKAGVKANVFFGNIFHGIVPDRAIRQAGFADPSTLVFDNPGSTYQTRH